MPLNEETKPLIKVLIIQTGHFWKFSKLSPIEKRKVFASSMVYVKTPKDSKMVKIKAKIGLFSRSAKLRLLKLWI